MARHDKLVSEMRGILSQPSAIEADSFGILRQLCYLANDHDEESDVQELVLRALEYRDRFGGCKQLLDALVRDKGLYPYLEPSELPVADQIAYEFHRPRNMDDWLVFHRPQASVYRALLDGDNVALSAPASFGKSLIIDAVIASGRYNNVVIVVPTIALIDETRRRLSRRFCDRFKIITHASQSRAERNIYILTQERVLEFKNLDDIDFFVIDEFYKLAPGRDADDERCALLNAAFYKLAKTGSQFYMLGPDILELSTEFRTRLQCRFVIEPYHTVVSELHEVAVGEDDFSSLVELCRTLTDPTIIYCSSPNRAAEVARGLVEVNPSQQSAEVQRATEWIAEHYHADWHFVRALDHGIGVHHGRIPRALAQYVVRQFNKGTIHFLVCTSTLIEGVNTTAKNVVIFDNTINRSRIDLFTFNNIKGRSGRMFEHFIGHVYIFHSAPQTDLPIIDVPAYTQPEEAPESLLMQIDSDDLTDQSKARLERFAAQDLLEWETLKRNVGIDPDAQLSLARTIADSPHEYHAGLSWTQIPRYDQLQIVCKLIWNHFSGWQLARGSVSSASQLTYLINRLRNRLTIAQLVELQNRQLQDADEAVQQTLDFIRLWATFHFPRLLRALDAIQRDVYSRLGMAAGNYEFFASSVEHLFFDPAITALDEYGIPLEVARKIESALRPEGNLDQALAALRRLRPERTNLTDFEKELVLDAQSCI